VTFKAVKLIKNSPHLKEFKLISHLHDLFVFTGYIAAWIDD